MKITDKQRQHLLVLQTGEAMSAYGNGLHMGILGSLEKKGLVRSTRGLGSIFSPTTAIKWRITNEGRCAVAATDRNAESS